MRVSHSDTVSEGQDFPEEVERHITMGTELNSNHISDDPGLGIAVNGMSVAPKHSTLSNRSQRREGVSQTIGM